MFDRIIVSSDDSDFKDFWPIVSRAWKKYFPDKKISLSFVTDKEEDHPVVVGLRKWGEVYLFPVIPNIPTPNQAKMYRHILAGQFNEEVCMIEDIDTIPLQKKFILDILSKRKKDHILRVGAEVYKGTKDEGKFPTSNLTAESYIFKKLINPENLDYDSLFKTWCNIRYYDHKESVNNTPDPTGSIGGFSDESLMRVLIKKYSPNGDGVCEIDRGVNIYHDWIDRSWWNIDLNRLKTDSYVLCNFLRPISENFQRCEPVYKYIFNNDEIKKEDVLINVKKKFLNKPII
jgi:hypothetical protein